MVRTRARPIERNELRRGDHIYTWRSGGYAHHGIYEADDRIIHYTACRKSSKLISKLFSPSGSGSSSAGQVSMCTLDRFLRNGSLYRFQYGVDPMTFKSTCGGTCTTARSDLPGTVIHRAMYLLDKGFGSYELFSHNCEDFALYCKTGLIVFGQGCSGQTVYANMFNLRGYVTMYWALIKSWRPGRGDFDAEYRYIMDIGNRFDAVRVHVEDIVE